VETLACPSHSCTLIVAKRAEAPDRPGDKRYAVKIKNYRSADCVVGGFRDQSIGSTHNELLLGLYDRDGFLRYIGSVGIDAKQKEAIGNLRSAKMTSFDGKQPGSHWSGEPAGPWRPVEPTKVIEVRYDHFSDGRFRHRCSLLRARYARFAKLNALNSILAAFDDGAADHTHKFPQGQGKAILSRVTKNNVSA